MLAKMFKVLETTEIQLTPKAVKRLRISALMSIPALPLFAVAELFEFSDMTTNLLLGFGTISFLALLYCATTRMANRLWVPEKHLDEVEVERKRRSGSLMYQVLLAFFAFFAGVFLALDGGTANTFWSPRAFTYFFGSLFAVSTSVQVAIAAWMTEPLSEPDAVKVAADVRYQWIVFAIVIGLVIINLFIKNLTFPLHP